MKHVWILVLGGALAMANLALARSPEDRAASIEAAWAGWLAEHAPGPASLAVSYRGRIILKTGRGGRDEDAPVVLASLSKAITAVCIDALFREQGIALSATLKSLEPPLSGLGVRVRDRVADITVSGLIAQSSGLTRDITQGTFNGNHAAGFAKNVGYANQALKASHNRKTGAYSYNNGNYAVLGGISEALAGEPQEVTCKRLIFAPLGITTARLNPEWKALGAFGGWEMSVGDYLRFAEAHFAPGTPIGDAPGKYPKVAVRNGAFYGMGVFFREQPRGNTFWHNGRICSEGRHTDRGTYFARLWNGWSYVASYDFCAVNGEDWDLDGLLYGAAVDPQ